MVHASLAHEICDESGRSAGGEPRAHNLRGAPLLALANLDITATSFVAASGSALGVLAATSP